MFKTTWRGQRTLEAASIIGARLALKLPLRAVRTIKSIMSMVYQVAEEIVQEHEGRLAAAAAAASGDQPGSGQKKTEPTAPTAAARDDLVSVGIRSGRFSHKELVTQTVHFLAAGTETVAGSTSWAVHLVSRHPAVQARLRAEVRRHVPSPAAAGARGSVERSLLGGLPYLNAVVSEVLRFHSINTLLWRECVDRSAVIAGVPIPVGTAVVWSPWAMNRDPKHWGPTARRFDPDRWLIAQSADGSAGSSSSSSGGADHPYSLLTFGAGPRACMGEQYARDEMLCMLAALVGRYHLAPLAPELGSDEGQEIGDDFALTLFKIREGWELNVTRIPGW